MDVNCLFAQIKVDSVRGFCIFSTEWKTVRSHSTFNSDFVYFNFVDLSALKVAETDFKIWLTVLQPDDHFPSQEIRQLTRQYICNICRFIVERKLC